MSGDVMSESRDTWRAGALPRRLRRRRATTSASDVLTTSDVVLTRCCSDDGCLPSERGSVFSVDCSRQMTSAARPLGTESTASSTAQTNNDTSRTFVPQLSGLFSSHFTVLRQLRQATIPVHTWN